MKLATIPFAAIAASFCLEYALCRAVGAQAGPALMAAVLALTRARRVQSIGFGDVLLAAVELTGTALAALGVAWLLQTHIVLGAIVFVGGMVLSVWLRNFGPRARALGALIAPPLVVILVAPTQASAPGGPLVDFALVLAAAVISVVCVAASQSIGARIGLRPSADIPIPAGEARLTVHTRMALQMGVALSAAFVAGIVVFPAHWAWTVLTAFIICSAARGRGDAVYTGALRLAGALVGTMAALIGTHYWQPSGSAEAIVIFAALFAALTLRDLNYAYWAAFITLILAMLSRTGAESVADYLWIRVAAIFIGALCAVVAVWFVYPIRTEAVVRRRLGQALIALDDLIQHATDVPERSARLALFEQRLIELDRAAQPVRWHRRMVGAEAGPEHPAEWAAIAAALRPHARAFVLSESAQHPRHAMIRRAIGVARRALGESSGIGSSLRAVHDALGSGLGPNGSRPFGR